MKKVVALILSAIMLLSVAALAEAPKSVTPFSVISTEPAEAGVDVKTDTDLVKALTDAIADAGMNEAFGAVVENPEEYSLAALGEISCEQAGEGFIVRLAVPAVTADNEVVVLLGVLVGSNVEWDMLEVVSVEDGVVTVRVTAEQAADIQSGAAVIAVLVK